MSLHSPISLGLLSLLLAWGTPLSPAWAQSRSLEDVQRSLDVAVCRNNWEAAVPLINQLITAPSTSAAYRTQLVDYRRQLEQWAATDAVLSNIVGCDLVLAQAPTPTDVPRSPALDVLTQQQQSNFNWDREIAALERRLYPEPPVLVAPSAAPLPSGTATSLLAGAIPIAIAQGSGQSNGEVSTGHQVHSFYANAGDQVSIMVNVTEELQGTFFMDDDSQLFLFDAQGCLIAENDDYQGFQSGLVMTLPASGQYFAVVTTFDNDPMLDSNGMLVGWPDDGSSAIRYTLRVNGVSAIATTP